MTTQLTTNTRSPSETQTLDRLVAEVVSRLEAGEAVDLEQIAAEHPRLIPPLEKLLPTLAAMADLGHSIGASQHADTTGLKQAEPSDSASAIGTLGDFRILRELGRGGMGVVYEAEQISLGRRVALKVLPLASTLNEQQLTRFKNEARAAATLKHPHIVGVYSVGVERGVHYYAMELVEGQSLAQVIEELRGQGTGDRGQGEVRGRRLEVREETGSSKSAFIHHQSEISTVAALSTVRTNNPQQYFRQAAQLIADATEALDYAHNQGIIHRDIKPGNLLLNAESKIFVTDFGLARLEADAGMTLTGDILGTLRYMSPEQAAGKAALVDHRTDIHALGATLFELVTLRPVYEGHERGELLQAIIHSSAPPLRQINPRVPVDLETIVAKCLEKEPADRYQSASDLAADLRAFLEHRTIIAKPPSLPQRIGKWSRRNQSSVALAMGALTLLLIVAVACTLLVWQEKRRTQTALEEAETQSVLAEKSATENEALVNYFVEDLIGSLSAWETRGKDISFYEVLVQNEKALESRFKDQPLLEAKVRESLSKVYSSLAEYDDAERHARRSLQLRQEILGNDPITLASQIQLSSILKCQGRDKEAYLLLDKTVTESEKLLGPNHISTLEAKNDLSGCLQVLQRFDEAVKLNQEVYNSTQAQLGSKHKYTLISKHNLAISLSLAGHKKEASEMIEEVQHVLSDLFGPDSYEAISTEAELARMHYEDSNYTRASTGFQHVLDVYERNFGLDDPRTIKARKDHTLVNRKLGDPNASKVLMEMGQLAYDKKLWPTLGDIAWDSIGKLRGREQAKMCFWRSIACSYQDTDQDRKFAQSIFEMGNNIREEWFPEDEELLGLRDEAQSLLKLSDTDPASSIGNKTAK